MKQKPATKVFETPEYMQVYEAFGRCHWHQADGVFTVWSGDVDKSRMLAQADNWRNVWCNARNSAPVREYFWRKKNRKRISGWAIAAAVPLGFVDLMVLGSGHIWVGCCVTAGLVALAVVTFMVKNEWDLELVR